MLARTAFTSALLVLGLTACDDAPPDLREWRVSDHDHTENPNEDQVQVSQTDAGASGMFGIAEVVVVAWRQNCVTCHGPVGRGDGPQGPMVRATDLTSPAWQKSATDETIARSIRTGKGTMPAFNLPDGTIDGLVRLIRLLDASKFAEAAAAASGAPPGSAAPHGSAAPRGSAALGSVRPAGSSVPLKPVGSAAPR